MTERKPPGVSFESWIDRQIRDGMERGEFDRLAGHGKPLAGLGRPRDEMWWARDKLRREGISYLPPTLELRKDVEDARAHLVELRSEAEVRKVLEDLNARIRKVNSQVTAGPPSTLCTFDVDAEVDRWRERRAATEG